MQIVWRLDEEEPLDLENLVGDIVIQVAQTAFTERATYIDSWLQALITGLYAVQAGHSTQVDIPEEPLPLLVEPWAQGVRITYDAMAIDVESLEEFQVALRLAAQALLCKLSTLAGWDQHQFCSGLRDFVCHPTTAPVQ